MWGTIITVALRLVGFWLDQTSSSQVARKKYLEFIMALQAEGLASVKVRKSFEDQLADLERQKAGSTNG